RGRQLGLQLHLEAMRAWFVGDDGVVNDWHDYRMTDGGQLPVMLCRLSLPMGHIQAEPADLMKQTLGWTNRDPVFGPAQQRQIGMRIRVSGDAMAVLDIR